MKTAIHTLATLAAVLMASQPVSAYTLDMSAGVFPTGVTVSNETGVNPATSGYKRGYTRDGWTIDRYGTYGYVAVSPTFTNKEEACRNIMTLPAIDIEEGYYLNWHGVSVHPDRKEKYSVTATVEGSGTADTLFATDSEEATWTAHLVDLRAYAGKKVTISFVCESSNRYMLAIGGVTVDTPKGVSFEVRDRSEVYSDASAAAAGHAPYVIDILNTGAALTEGEIRFDANYEPAATTAVEGTWLPGETRTFTFDAPVTLNKRTACETYYVNGGESTLLAENTLYCSTFKKRLFVDKGTGMWCNNCPKGILAIQTLENRFGDALIAVDTHANDILKNQSYWDSLGFSSIPNMKLNRITNSMCEDGSMFTSFYYKPVEFDIAVTETTVNDSESARVKVAVRCASETDNSGDNYRVGYVLTGDFHKDTESPTWYQENSCTQPTQLQYYYLPSTLISPLAYFNHASLTSDHAFDGFENSLPATMDSEGTYSFEWDIERPERLDDIINGRVVAFVLDTKTGEIKNSVAYELKNSQAGIGSVESDSDRASARIVAGKNGEVRILTSEATDYTLEAWSLNGGKAASESGHTTGHSVVKLQLGTGAYVLRLTTPSGQATAKVII